MASNNVGDYSLNDVLVCTAEAHCEDFFTGSSI